MARVYIYHSFKLKEGASTEDFLLAAKKLSNEPPNSKGFISLTTLVDGETWADILVYESMEDFNNANQSIHKNPCINEYISFIDPDGITSHHFTVAANS